MDETSGESMPLSTNQGGVRLPGNVTPLATRLPQDSMTDIEDTLSKATNVSIEKHFNNVPYNPIGSICCGMYPWFVVKVGERKLFIVKFTQTGCLDRKCFPYYRFFLPGILCPAQHAHLKMKYLKPNEDIEQYSQEGDLTDPFAEIYAMDRICCMQCCSERCFWERHYLESAEKNPNSLMTCCFNPCGGPNIEVKNPDDSVKYVVTGSCFQLGFLCGTKTPLCCTRMQVDFDIVNESGNRVGGITKPAYDCIFCNYETFDYNIDLPNDASFENKLQIIMSAIMIDCQFFQILPRC